LKQHDNADNPDNLLQERRFPQTRSITRHRRFPLKPRLVAFGLWLAADSEAIASAGPTGWSTLSGKTIGAGQTAILAQLGWPGFSATLLHGVAPAMDLGGRLTFNYGEEGIVTQVVPGIRLQGVARLTFFDNGKLNFGMQFEPGPVVYFTSFQTTAGLVLPVGLRLGIPLSEAFLLSFGVEAPVFRIFGSSGGWIFPVLFGAGLEYFVAPNLAATLNARAGPSVDTRGFRPVSNLALEALFGVAYRF
jgi:hypothetical protein